VKLTKKQQEKIAADLAAARDQGWAAGRTLGMTAGESVARTNLANSADAEFSRTVTTVLNAYGQMMTACAQAMQALAGEGILRRR
jgi:hypothetical protein